MKKIFLSECKSESETVDKEKVAKSLGVGDHEKIIDMEELKKRHGIIRDKTGYFKAYMKFHLEGQLCHNNSSNLIGLAQYIVSQKELYISKHGGYKLMVFSSILAELRKFHKQESILWKKEKQVAKIEADNTKKDILYLGAKSNP